ncbi:hypothetical protein PTSG_04222 [Salpingoeca rosetta]|uniref:Uncharacterized protein n=1 Tax=Salpingoeca rosetta (strain ATCC 50818 / BSB-021) TaxID=946362 RepID=F2U6Y2_SALR5|nr:uncharacterized protein PTSG_04222 [Salpingoeca rosetta]EGD83614.1 hypothetical protein PTSG_04222 [Salpingoeca rosetta]|eukprot:XP_004995118.1 hypothetical protein PTSG_04222 [Salpingoeca rosetta]
MALGHASPNFKDLSAELFAPVRMRFSPTGRQLVTASFDGTVCVWERTADTVTEWECYATLEGHENEVKDACFSASGEYLASCSRDKTVWIWEHLEDTDEYDCCSILNDHTQDVKCLRWHPSLDLLASGSYDNTICLYRPDPDISDWTRVAHLTGHESTVWSLAFNASGSLLASASDDKTVRIWKFTPPEQPSAFSGTDGTWTCVTTLSGFHTRSVYSVDWCHVTNLLATGCGDNHVRVFRQTQVESASAPSFEKVYDDQTHTQDVNAVLWCAQEPAGHNATARILLASASDDEVITLARFQEMGPSNCV